MTGAAAPDPTGSAPPLLPRIAVLALIAIVVGALASMAAVGFVEFVRWLNDVLLVSPRARVEREDAGHLLLVATIAAPTLGGLTVGLMLRGLSPDRRPLGPADVIEAAQLGAPLPDPRSGLVSTLAAALSLGCGASVGQYGPMVYLGALIGGAVRRLPFGGPNLPAIAIACGVAAAISTAFNAPIAGIVFAHEVVLRHYATQAFAPVTVASATGFVIDTVVFEREPLLRVDFQGVGHGHEFLLFAALGLACATVAVVFMRLMVRISEHAETSAIPAVLRPAVAGLAVGLTALWLPDVLGVGWEAQRFATIEGAFGTGELVVLVAAKLVLTALCLGFGFSGGVFSPSLLMGALFGALFWTLVDGSGLAATSGVAIYALSGMVALASPVIGAPLTCILIVFELTRNYDVSIAAMVAVVFSNLVSHRVFGRSIFDVQLARRGIDLSHGREQARLASTPALNLATRDFVEARAGAVAAEIVARIAEDPRWNEAFVVDDEGRFAGVFRISPRAGSGPVAAASVPASATLDETTSVAEAMRRLGGFVGDAVPVVHSRSGALLGVVPEAELIAAYLAVSRALKEEENAAL